MKQSTPFDANSSRLSSSSSARKEEIKGLLYERRKNATKFTLHAQESKATRDRIFHDL
jgi:hypothetical protein